jgi:hypothetical protein
VSVLEVITPAGRKEIEFDPKDEAQVKEVEHEFDRLTSHGHMARTATPGKKSEQIRAFDPTEERIVVHTPLAGG